MTAHTTISNALVAVGAKPFATTMQAMRDNLYSVIEGDATAVAAGKTIDIGALKRLVVGSVVKIRNDAEQTSAVAGTIGVVYFSFLQKGTVRCTAEWKSNGAATATQTVSRTREGVTTTLSSVGTTSSVYQAFSADVDVLPGDSVNLSVSCVSAVTFASRNRRMNTDGANYWPVSAGINMEGNIYS